MSNTIADLLFRDPLGETHYDLVHESVTERLGGLLNEDLDRGLVRSLYPFVTEIPWRYWDQATLETALEILENDRKRTIRAINERTAAVDRAVQTLFRPSAAAEYEGSYIHSSSRDLVRIATEFIPDYLRWAEQIFGNLLAVYWSIHRKGGVDAKFGLKSGAQHFRNEGLPSLVAGYHEKIRNAIAHGEFRFTGDIEFGANYPKKCSSSEFLREYDELCRTANALCLGLLLFVVRHERASKGSSKIPLSIVSRIAGGGMNRPGLELVGVVDSSTPVLGKQLHISLRLDDRNRTQVLAQCTRTAAHLLAAGATGFDRYVIEVDHGREVSSLVVLRPRRLQRVLQEEVEEGKLEEVIEGTPLLWFDERLWRTRLRAWRIILKSVSKDAYRRTLSEWRDQELWPGKGRYRVREIENISTSGIARVRLRAVLLDPEDAEDRKLIENIVWELVKLGRRRLISSRPSKLDSGVPWPKRPTVVIVDLFREDGTLRWLKGGGWVHGNLVAVGERTWRGRDPVQVEQPEDTFKKIGIRYQINKKEARAALRRARELINKIRSKRGQTPLNWEND